MNIKALFLTILAVMAIIFLIRVIFVLGIITLIVGIGYIIYKAIKYGADKL